MQLKSGAERLSFTKAAEKPKKKPWVKRGLMGIFITVAAVTGFIGLNSQVAETQQPEPTAVTETVQQPAASAQQAANPPAVVQADTPYVSKIAGAEQWQRNLTPGERQ